jgi:hypothetical protein
MRMIVIRRQMAIPCKQGGIRVVFHRRLIIVVSEGVAVLRWRDWHQCVL